MSNSESRFIKWLAGIVLPFIIIGVIHSVIMFADNRHRDKTVDELVRKIDEFRKYYLTVNDFYNYHDALQELCTAIVKENTDDIKRLEKELDDFRNQFGIKTRGSDTALNLK